MSDKDIFITIPKEKYDKLLTHEEAIRSKKHLWVSMTMYGSEYITLVEESEVIDLLQKRLDKLEAIGIVNQMKKGFWARIFGL